MRVFISNWLKYFIKFLFCIIFWNILKFRKPSDKQEIMLSLKSCCILSIFQIFDFWIFIFSDHWLLGWNQGGFRKEGGGKRTLPPSGIRPKNVSKSAQNGHNSVFIVFKESKINLVDLKKSSSKFSKIFWNPPSPLEKILNPPWNAY